ncbi:MAG: glycosyltransferase family 4 protein [Alphaproteobacteria bacterium]|nr:glycosyltransferase family 4 protein [Alphaproteobacteria bacterium]
MTGVNSSNESERRQRRIFYLSKHFGHPLGGVRIAYHHVAVLNRHGFDAAMLLVDGMKDNFFDTNVPVARLSPEHVIRPTDIYVIPEPWKYCLQRFAEFPVRRLVFCQNHFYLYHGLEDRWSFDDYGVHQVFCCSEVIAQYLQDIFDLKDVPIIHNGIDHDVFRPAPAKKRQIAYMPRKMKVESIFIRETFRRRHPQYADVPWVQITNRTEAQVGGILGESAVFMALGRIEGFGLPPLEAMASGCIVVGFTGDGGRSYATAENGLWCTPEDWMGTADALAQALGDFDRDGGRCWVEAGRVTADQYTLDRMEREIVAFWEAEVRR